MDLMTGYRTAQELFDSVVTRVPDDAWDTPTTCSEWTARDIVGHVTWGQGLIGALARAEPFEDRTGAPGSAKPSEYLAGQDPVAAWRTARDRAGTHLTEAALATPLPEPMRARPDSTVASFAEILEFDTLTHAWDVAHPLGIDLDPPDSLVARLAERAPRVVRRAPGFFGPEVPPPPDADPLGVLLSLTGRTVTPARAGQR